MLENAPETPASVFLGGQSPLRLECGVELKNFPVAYQTYGKLNTEKSNAILVCHALSGDQYIANTHPCLLYTSDAADE